MPYYKITFESNTIEGLKAIQGSFLGHGASATDSTTFETAAPPPRQQGEGNLDAFSGVVQPPPTANEAGASLDKSAFYQPPPRAADIGLEGIPPPPKDELRNQEGTEPDEGSVPPTKSGSKSPKVAKKSSK